MFSAETKEACALANTAQAISKLKLYEVEQVKEVIKALDLLKFNMRQLPLNQELTYDLSHTVKLEGHNIKIKSLLD